MRSIRITAFRSVAFVAASAMLAAAAAAAPTPVPGGAMQTAGVAGPLGGTLFNGTYRLRTMSFASAAPADRAGPLETLVFHAIVSNGTQRSKHGYFNASLADADGVTVTGRPLDDGWDLAPGAASCTSYGFALPAGFVPVRLVLIEAAGVHPKAFRVAIPANALPASAPAPTAT